MNTNTDTNTSLASETGFFTVDLLTSKSKAPDGFRLSEINFKTPKAKKNDPAYKKPDARCIAIPKIKVHSTPDNLSEAWQNAFYDLQDALIRDLIITALDEKKSIITLMAEQINVEAVAKFAADSATSGKLTKEQIHDWFDDALGDLLTLRVAVAMRIPADATPTPQQEKAIADAVTNYRTSFSSLAAPKAGLSQKIAKQLHSVLHFAEDVEHRVYRSLDSKLTDVIAAQDPDLIALNLGVE